MKKKHIGFSIVALLVAGCNSTPPAVNFSGSWQPINVYSTETLEIPLIRQHYFEPLPIDGTLKNMLSRWAREAGYGINYTHTSDFTLPLLASKIKQPNVEAALVEINDIYAPQKIGAFIENNQIVVRARVDEPILPDSAGLKLSVVDFQNDKKSEIKSASNNQEIVAPAENKIFTPENDLAEAEKRIQDMREQADNQSAVNSLVVSSNVVGSKEFKRAISIKSKKSHAYVQTVKKSELIEAPAVVGFVSAATSGLDEAEKLAQSIQK